MYLSISQSERRTFSRWRLAFSRASLSSSSSLKVINHKTLKNRLDNSNQILYPAISTFGWSGPGHKKLHFISLPTSWPFSETFCWGISVSPRLPPIRSPTRRIPRTPCHKRGIAGRRWEGWMTKQRCPYQRLRSTSQANMLTIPELIAAIRFTFDAFNTSTYSGRALTTLLPNVRITQQSTSYKPLKT